MARPASATLTDGELRLMRVLWDRGPSTASEVTGALAEGGVSLAESTVRTLLGILRDKGYVAADGRNRGRAHRAVVGREQARRQALHHLLDRFFDDSREELVLTLIRDEGVSPKELARLRRIVLEDR